MCGLRLEAVADVMFMTPQLRQKELLKLHGKKGLSCLPVDLTSMAQAMRRIPKESQKQLLARPSLGQLKTPKSTPYSRYIFGRLLG